MNDTTGTTELTGMAGIDRILHEPARMQVAALLYVVESADFTFVMNQTGLTWGNLSAHLSKLEEAGYVEIDKGYRGKRPNTTLRLTDQGRAAFKEYILKMRQLFADFPI
jgi:DNA-binding MarR family transcriptional regulator